MKILVVEDDPGTRALIARVAAKSADAVIEAENGLDALALVEREDPDLVITDLHLPLVDGFEFVAAIRGTVAHQSLPVICVSVINDRTDIERLPGLHIDDYLLKPVNPIQLDQRIRRVLLKTANWRSRSDADPQHGAMHRVLIIDPDAAYREFLRSVLEPAAVEVLEESSGATGLAKFKELEAKPDSVFVAEDLPMLSAASVVDLFGRISNAASAPMPRLFLIANHAETTTEPPAGFMGVVRRSHNAGEFTADMERWLPGQPNSEPEPAAVGN